MSPSPMFARATVPPEEIAARHIAESAAVFARYSVPSQVIVKDQIANGVPIRIYETTKGETKRPMLIWMHGGAFIGGSMDMPEGQVTCFEIAARTSAIVVQIEYRLATDDTLFPELQKDVLAAAEWVLNHQAELGFDPSKIFVAGASAGASLAGSLALMLRDRGVALAGVIPIYAIGHRTGIPPTPELQAHCDNYFGKPQSLMHGHNEWLDPEPTKNREYYPWPAETNKLEGLAPHHFIHADYDILRSSGEPWAQKLRDAGVVVEEEVVEGSTHGYLNKVPSETPPQDYTLNRMAQIISATH